MATRLTFLFMGLGFCTLGLAQGVKISPQPGTPDPSAILETQDTTRGVLMPRVNLQSSTDGVTILNPATSLMVFNTGTTLAPAGFYYNAGTPQAPQWALVLPNPANTALNMNGFAIENLATPVNPADAVTKDYVDNQIINVSGSGGGGCACPTMLSNESANTMNIGNALRYCYTLNEGGFTDWHLPSLDELFKVCSTGGNTVPNNNSSNLIWAANMTQVNGYNYNYAMHFRLSDGYFYYSPTSNTNNVRCVR
ncbi:MAG: DUF1566 domain-containing protein [Bacteroidia bacterium]